LFQRSPSALTQGKSDPVARNIDFKNPDHDLLADLDHLGRVPNIAVGQLTDVDQPVLMHADVDKGPELGHIGDQTGQPHARLQVIDTVDPGGKSKFA
jgi:hypothetical protein